MASTREMSWGLKVSGWSWPKKHMPVDPEPPKFTDPETKNDKHFHTGDSNTTGNEKYVDAEEKSGIHYTRKETRHSKYGMLHSSRCSPLRRKSWTRLMPTNFKQSKISKNNLLKVPSFVHHLPVLLYSLHFDIQKLKEAAAKPLTKVVTVFQRRLLHHKTEEEELKDFNTNSQRIWDNLNIIKSDLEIILNTLKIQQFVRLSLKPH